MARVNLSWGYTKIRDPLRTGLKIEIGRTTVADILSDAGIEPAPEAAGCSVTGATRADGSAIWWAVALAAASPDQGRRRAGFSVSVGRFGPAPT
jgi:hypothetical protein